MSSKVALSYNFLFDKMKRIYPPMSNLVRREQEKNFFRLKTAVNYGTVKRQAGAEVSKIRGFSSFRRFLLLKSTVDV